MSFVFDTETTGLDPHQAELIGMSFAYQPGEAYYVPVPEDFEAAKKIAQAFEPLFIAPKIIKIGQNIKYDLIVLKKYGIALCHPLFDTMLAHYLLTPEVPHNMNAMAEHALQYAPLGIEMLIGKKGPEQVSMRDVGIEKVTEYACEDAEVTLQLKCKFAPALVDKKLDQLFYNIEMPLVAVLAAMESAGVKIDPNTLHGLSKAMATESEQLAKDIYALSGTTFNIASPKQLGVILFEKLKLMEAPPKTKTGQNATGEAILVKLAEEHAIAKKILNYRELQKLKSTYIDALPTMIIPMDGRIHTSFNQAITATGRLSSTHPNLQNIPIRTQRGRLIRKAFVAKNPDYLLLSADYSQIELRIMAAFAQDESMIAAFKDGKDIHTATAGKLFNVPLAAVTTAMRRQAKIANFGIIYGISAFGLAQRLHMPKKEAAVLIASYFQEFPAVKTYIDQVIEEARTKEYVTTLMGRKRFLRDINSRNATLRGFSERNAVNAPIQGTAADMIKCAMTRIHTWMQQEKLQSKMILQVHDELVFDVYQTELTLLQEKVPVLMKNALPIVVPIAVSTLVGAHWGGGG